MRNNREKDNYKQPENKINLKKIKIMMCVISTANRSDQLKQIVHAIKYVGR